jgi:signal transduction histidine kinase
LRAIERTLLIWLLGMLSLGLTVVGLAMYLVTQDEMHEVLNADLKNVADAIGTYQWAAAAPEQATAPGHAASAPVSDDTDIFTFTWTATGQRLHVSKPGLNMPFSNKEGLSHVTIGGEEWAVYTMVQDSGVVQAAQRSAARHEVAVEAAFDVVPLMLALLVLMGALMVFALRRGLRPLDHAAREVAERSERSLDPIATTDTPRELVPLVQAVNALMRRLQAAMSVQKRFMADAAHELRTPATSLRLQLQLLESATSNAERESSMRALKASIDRSERLIGQLLQVARTETDGEPVRHEPVDLGALARSVVAAMSAKADHKQIDLGAITSNAPIVQGDAGQLTVLLNNLVENALRHTPDSGRVDVRAEVHAARPALVVSDNGPGIAPADRERVFERFVRGTHPQSASHSAQGSGLGLAIVKAIAQRHGATVRLDTAEGGSGLAVTVEFPYPAGAAR